MKAFLLAAGEGTRLRPITNSIPKCLVPIRRQPLLEIWLDLCRAYGIDEVLINLHAHGDAVRQFVSQRDFGIRVRFFEERVLLGSAGTIAANRAWVESDPCFWVFYADVLTNMDLARMLAFHRRLDLAATLGLYRVPNPSQCGIVEVDAAHVIRGFTEKPALPAGNLAFTGVMIGTPELLRALPVTVPSDLGFHVFPRLLGRMAAYVGEEYLIDVGTMANYEAAQRTWPGVQLSPEPSHA
jgi:mannose-1-phosphate guanylyltransferase